MPRFILYYFVFESPFRIFAMHMGIDIMGNDFQPDLSESRPVDIQIFGGNMCPQRKRQIEGQ
jgi:hypothetical protein